MVAIWLDWALKDLDLAASAAGIGVVPVASVIADRWRELLRNGASGLDVSAARNGLGVEEPPYVGRHSTESTARDGAVSDTRQATSTSS